MSNNMELWDKLKTPPPEALKKITGGRLSGKSDINPQWRYQAMTEAFGICGFGWKYEIVKEWTEQGTDGQAFAFVNINLYVKNGSEWSEAIPANGGNMLIEQEKSGLHCNDEAFKMATTDALGNAMKMLGLAAEVYRGNMDGSKYAKPPKAAQTAPQSAKLSEKDHRQLEALLVQKGVSRDKLKEGIAKKRGKDYHPADIHLNQLTADEFKAAIQSLNKKPDVKKEDVVITNTDEELDEALGLGAKNDG